MNKVPSNEKKILWDHSSLGPPQLCHPTGKRNVTVILKDRIFGLASRTLQNMETNECVFLGSINTDKTSEGLVVMIDRFEEQQRQPTLSLPGDLEVPVWFGKKRDVVTTSVTDYINDLKSLVKKCGNRFEVDLSNVVKIRLQCNVEGPNCCTRVELIIPGTTFKVIQIPSVPVAQSALYSSLTSMSRQALYKSGLLTIDQSRKIIYLLENDPRIFSAQLVGIWVSGVDVVHHPYVWAACLRYLTCPAYICRICLPPKPFLLSICTTVSLEPEYYDAFVINETQFHLLTGDGSLTVTKVPSFSSNITVMDLALQTDLQNSFSEAKAVFLKERKETMVPVKPEVDLQSNVDDFPRSIPVAQQVRHMEFGPSVPDLSLLSEGGYGNSKHLQNKDDDYNVLGRKFPLQALSPNFPQTFEEKTYAKKSTQFDHRGVWKNSNAKMSIGRMRYNDENEPLLPTKSPKPISVPEVPSNFLRSMPRGNMQPEKSNSNVNVQRHSVQFISPIHALSSASVEKTQHMCARFETRMPPPQQTNVKPVPYCDKRRKSFPAGTYFPNAQSPLHVEVLHSCGGDSSLRIPPVRRSFSPQMQTNNQISEKHCIENSLSIKSQIDNQETPRSDPNSETNWPLRNAQSRDDKCLAPIYNSHTTIGLDRNPNFNSEMPRIHQNTESPNPEAIISHHDDVQPLCTGRSQEQSDNRNNSSKIHKIVEKQDQKLQKLAEQIQKLLEAQTPNCESVEEEQASVTSSKSSQSECNENLHVYEMLKQQDEQLRRLQEQINSVLELHQSSPVQKQLSHDSGLGDSPKVCHSVGIMTSFCGEMVGLPKNSQCCEAVKTKTLSCCSGHCCITSKHKACQENASAPLHGLREKCSPAAVDNTEDLSLHLSNLNVQTVCEPPPSLPTSIHVDMNDYALSCVGPTSKEADDASPTSCGSASCITEQMNRCERNCDHPYDDPGEIFCHKLLGNINCLLESRTDDVIVNERFDSFLLPKLNYQTLHLSDLDLDLGDLSQKYLDKPQIKSMMSSTKMFVERRTLQSDGQPSDTTLYGLSSNVSYSTKMYLEKYGLARSGDSAQDENEEQSMWIFSKYKTGKSNVPLLQNAFAYGGNDSSNTSRILDMQALRLKPKLL